MFSSHNSPLTHSHSFFSPSCFETATYSSASRGLILSRRSFVRSNADKGLWTGPAYQRLGEEERVVPLSPIPCPQNTHVCLSNVSFLLFWFMVTIKIKNIMLIKRKSLKHTEHFHKAYLILLGSPVINTLEFYGKTLVFINSFLCSFIQHIFIYADIVCQANTRH